jgi:hypothetical protein
MIRQAEVTGRGVDVLRDFRHRPAVDFFGRAEWAMTGSDLERKQVARVVEMHELFQALDVATVKELLWKYGIGLPFASNWSASVVGHCGGVMATFRAVITCIWPSTLGANFVQFEFGLGPEPKPFLKTVPNPKSR